jgi:hypothetical protein
LSHYVTDLAGPGQFIALEDWRHQEWVPADLAQQCVLRSRVTGRTWMAGDEERAKEAGIERRSTEVHEEVKSCTDSGDWSRYPSAEFLASVSRDPRQLYDLLRHKPMPSR